MLMTAEQYREFMEQKFAEYIRPIIAEDIHYKIHKLIGSHSPVRFDHPEASLCMRYFKHDSAETIRQKFLKINVA